MSRFIVLIAMLFAFTGCQKKDEIVLHRIPKSRSDLDRFERALQPPNRQSPAAAAVPTRMVVGLANRDDAIWFFKISGPVEQVNLSEPIWRKFFAELSFTENGQPVWQLPKGWSAGPGKSMRFATIYINDSSPPLEMSISSLGPNQSLVDNVNRWRRQLSLGPIAKADLKLGEIPYPGGELLIFDEVGLSAGRGMGGPMIGGSPPIVPSESTLDPPSNIKFSQLDGWETSAGSPMVKVRLLKSAGDKKAQITVSEMPADANAWEPNVIRWAVEIGMTEFSGPDASIRTSKVSIDGVDAQRLRLIEPGDQYASATVAVMAKRGQSAWFFKISGDKSLVENSETEFDEFLTTFRFDDNN